MSSLWNGLQDLLGGTLTFFYELVPNFGVAIILLTVAIGLVLFPLTLKQTRSMKAMQEIQPEIKRIQKEFKTDKPAQQQAMMALYKERGVNPAAGCLPLVLQMPVWFALFSVLRSFGAVELIDRLKYVTSGSALEGALNAQKELVFLWMNLSVSPNEALSGSDTIPGSFVKAIPYLITIALVVFTAYWQQKQTMAKQPPGQQAQPGQAVMKIFPFFFGFISFNLPAGLVVYFAASQLFRIGQQSLILGLDTKRRVAAPPEKPKGSSSPAPRPADPGASGAAPTPSPTRRPQGSKKRGKKRRRN
ncbi:MAG TPA: membrane protein insertase YidC [Acidimicrobiia bacterium]|nr:membrane protein insertase YidC [Acidimicrobiia bacterium]